MNVRPLALLLCLAACQAQPAPTPPLARSSIGGPFTLIDQDGRTVTDRSFAGQYRIMYFGYTSCPDVCPTDMANVGGGLKLLEREQPELARRVTPIFVSVDPERDTPAMLKAFVRNFHPRMVGLTGSTQAIARTAEAFKVYAKKGDASPSGGYLVNHTRQTYLFDPAGKPLALLPSDANARAVADEIERWAR